MRWSTRHRVAGNVFAEARIISLGVTKSFLCRTRPSVTLHGAGSFPEPETMADYLFNSNPRGLTTVNE